MQQREIKEAVERLRRISDAGVSFADVQRVISMVGSLPAKEAGRALELLELAAGIRLQR